MRDGTGAVSMGRGGTNIAFADTGASLLDNPAAMVNIEGGGLAEMDATMLFCNIDYAEPGFTENVSKLYPLGHMSFIKKSPSGRWAFGLGVFTPAGFGAEYHMPGPPAIGGDHLYKSFGALAKIIPGLAYKVNDRTSIGGTIGVGAMHAELEGPFFLQTGALSGAPTVLDLQGTGATLVWSLGLQHKLSERTTIGVTYQSESRFFLDGTAAADIYHFPAPGNVTHSRFDADVDFVWPRSVGIGIKHDLCPHRRLSADVIWYDWRNAFKSLDIRLNDPTNPLVAGALGSTISDSFPMNWRDSVSLRLGYEHDFRPNATFRAGYVFHPDPIPNDTLCPYIPATLEHDFMFGLGLTRCDWRFDISYAYAFAAERHVGTSAIVGGDFDNSNVKSQTHWLNLGLTKRF